MTDQQIPEITELEQMVDRAEALAAGPAADRAELVALLLGIDDAFEHYSQRRPASELGDFNVQAARGARLLRKALTNAPSDADGDVTSSRLLRTAQAFGLAFDELKRSL